MNFLDFIPGYIFESIGFIAGITACFVIALQVIKEYKSKQPSSLSHGYVIGWGLIFIFWGLYGIRFDAIALWTTNSIASILQAILFIVIVKKQKQ